MARASMEVSVAYSLPSGRLMNGTAKANRASGISTNRPAGVVSVKNQVGVGATVSSSHGKSLPKVSGRNR